MATIADAGRLAPLSPARLSWFRAAVRSWPGRTVLLAASSTVIGIIFALPMWATQWRQSLAQWWAWALLVPLIAWADRRLPFTPVQMGRRAWAHFAGSLLFTALYLHVFYAMRALLGNMPWDALRPWRMFSLDMMGWYLWSLLIYWMIACSVQAYRYYERYLVSELRLERLEKSYTQARLNALRMQLDPHFLFNALNTISSHVERDPRLTRRMIEHLGDLLRISLETKDRQEIPLAEELAFLEHYLEIQRIRFGDQLLVEVEVAPEVRYAQVPCLLLQPLVENAIRHGISRRVSGGAVTVTASEEAGQLRIAVEDDGVGLPQAWSPESSNGLGLSVTRERLTALYGAEGSFALLRRPEGGTRVEITLPVRMVGEAG